MICTYFKLCVLELSEKMPPGGGDGGDPLPTPAWRQFFHPVHTYFVVTRWGGGRGERAQILKRANHRSFSSDRAF